MSEQKTDFDSWCILELLGHVRLAGRVTEEERFGQKMGRIDIPGPCRKCDGCGGFGTVIAGTDMPKCPQCGGNGTVPTFVTQYFSGSSVYRLTPCSQEAAFAVAQRNAPQPVHPFELPAPRESLRTGRNDDEERDEDDIPY